MEVHSPHLKSVSNDGNNFPTSGAAYESWVCNIENDFCESLRIQNSKESESEAIGGDNGSTERGALCERPKFHSAKSAQRGLGKSVTSPYPDVTLPPSDEEGEKEKGQEEPEAFMQVLFSEDHVPFGSSRPTSPTPLKLVPAMKGSREKLGLSPKKLSVTWAPDVYDPPSTSLSHTVTKSKTKQRVQNKKNDSKRKNLKNKQKGNSTRVSGGGKKQFRKAGGSAARERVGDVSDDYDFAVGGPDYCVSSFLKQSLTKVQYSTAEA